MFILTSSGSIASLILVTCHPQCKQLQVIDSNYILAWPIIRTITNDVTCDGTYGESNQLVVNDGCCGW